jgi:hypothetical protein
MAEELAAGLLEVKVEEGAHGQYSTLGGDGSLLFSSKSGGRSSE